MMRPPGEGHSYALDVGGWIIAQITEVSQAPGGQVTLTRRLTGPGLDFETWLRHARLGGPHGSRRDGTLIAYDAYGHPTAHYVLRDAWPISLHVVHPSTQGSTTRVERLVLTFAALTPRRGG
ncbi:phage tail protein [Streptosporangiaceae bacterium NEAU-GS5]|nr:phage tail protein [Streptosporangiaceae bacterium NEAU-GS5]